MAVTPTYPSRDNLNRLRFRPLDVAVGLAVVLLIYLIVRVGAGAKAPVHQATTFDTSPAQLPYYAARSLLRMFIALFFSYAFSLGYAYAAARSRRWRRVLIPALDILQSVPVLGLPRGHGDVFRRPVPRLRARPGVRGDFRGLHFPGVEHHVLLLLLADQPVRGTQRGRAG